MVRILPRGRTDRARAGLAVVLSAVLLGGLVVGPAHADDDGHGTLTSRKNKLDKKISASRGDLHEISSQLIRAQGRVDVAVADLDAARVRLANLRDQVAAAARRDERMQEKLDLAIERLDDARLDLENGRANVRSQRADLAAYAVQSTQSGGSQLLNLEAAFDAENTEDALTSLQIGETALDQQSVELQEFEAAELLLTLTEERVEKNKDAVAEVRQEAAENLKRKRGLENKAEQAKKNVVKRLASLREMRREVAAAKKEELRRIHQLEGERDRVEERLRKIAEQRARERQRRQAARNAPLSSSTPSNAGGFLSYPVADTYITSPYGMRFHPILHYYKLHDGTDFHAPCGVPVYAAASGTVTSTYYNAGYGNRIIIDHGVVKGQSLWTSYNHLTSFATSPGRHVDRGELIGYAGTTGYSTGCHLHFMVYTNGYTSNPMGWL